MGLVYKITNTVNDKSYIGITRYTFHVRYNYRKDWWNAPSVNKILRQSVNKHGPEHFKVVIVEDGIDVDHLEQKEKFYIWHYNSFAPNGYNLTRGGEYNKEVSEETKRRLTEAQKLRWINGEIPWNRGKKLSPEHIQKTLETKRKKYLSGELKPWNKGLKTGRPSEEAVKNSAIGHYKKVICYRDGIEIKIYESCKSTEKDGFNPCQVSGVALGNQKTHRGCTFRYYNDVYKQ